MSKIYHILSKKATFALILSFFLFLPPPVGGLARARVPADPRYPEQAAMYSQINAPVAWDYTVGSKEVVVAVIDAGIDTWHEDIRDNIWVNKGEIPDNGLDDDKNGYADDVNGWNFVEDNNDPRISVLFNDTDGHDPEAVRHGTIIAGILGARGDNGLDGTGLNWRAQIMPIRAVASDGSGSYNMVARAVEYAVSNGADIITMSFVGSNYNERLRAALRRAYDRGVVVVSAVGNGADSTTDKPVYPACLDQDSDVNWMLAVAAVSSSDRLSRFSNYGSCVDILAPGENISSTERYAPEFGYDNLFGGGWSGTSFSTPFVAGAAALLKSFRPNLTAAQIISLLLKSADNVDIQNQRYIGKLGAGRLNVGKALDEAAKMFPVFNGPVFSFNGSNIYTVEPFGRRLLTWVEGGQIRGVSSYPLWVKRHSGIVAAVQRGKYNYLRFFDQWGGFYKEYGIDLKFKLPIKTISVSYQDDNYGHIVIEQYRRSRKETIFSEFSGQGELIKTTVIKDKKVKK